MSTRWFLCAAFLFFACSAAVAGNGRKPADDAQMKAWLENAIWHHHFSDAEVMEQILLRIGFVRVLRFEKRRETWTLEGCEVALDELPRLGRFVEIEGPSDAAVMQVRQKLGLEEAPLLTSSYVGMLSHRLDDRDAHPRDVRF